MFTLSQLATYPFLPGAREYLARLSVSLDLLAESPELRDRTQERIHQALDHRYVLPGHNPELELLSFAGAGMICAAVQSDVLSKTWPRAEARRIERSLQQEPAGLLDQMVEHFGWRTRSAESPYEVAVPFNDYVSHTQPLRDSRWRLVNRAVNEGYVSLTRKEMTTLISVDAARWIRSRIDQVGRIQVPESVQPLIGEIGEAAARVEARLRGMARTRGRWEPPWVPMLLRGVGKGMRDEAAIRLASYYVNVRRLPDDQIIEILINWNKKNQPPIGRVSDDPSNIAQYFETKIKSARRGRYVYGPNDTLVKQLVQRAPRT